MAAQRTRKAARKGKEATDKVSVTEIRAPKTGLGRLLYLVVFLSGASLMSLELVGSRIIAPTFGASIYTWGSLIGIVMFALSVGYYLGGILADRKPSYFTLAVLLSISGAMVIVIPYVSLTVCELFAPLKQRWGSFFACMTLFGAPSVLMGMVSPMAIKLHARELAKVGGVAGSLYAVSTFGSIVGTFITAFFLLEMAGMTALTQGIGVVLLATALIAAFIGLKAGVSKKSVASVLILFIGATAFALASTAPPPVKLDGKELIARMDSPYNTLFVLDSGTGALAERRLQFNDRAESGIYLQRPHECSFSYSAAMHTMFAYRSEIKDMLLIGGGGAALPIEFVCAYDDEDLHIDSVEIDPGVIEYSMKYFIDYAADFYSSQEASAKEKLWARRIRENIELIQDDGRLFVRRMHEKGRKYDAIILDAYLGGRIPFHLTTRSFFRDLAGCLSEDGVMAMNVIGGFRGDPSLVFQSIYKTASEFFPHIMLVPTSHFAASASTPSKLQEMHEYTRNIVMICAPSESMAIGSKTFRSRMQGRIAGASTLHS
ncbi:MAG: fused MFS/spermidine synthase [Planctomycetota bacterium]|nr:fused MFS/spermidine synthase [Planctomycetota bacterium]